jgi:hypothetical protein
MFTAAANPRDGFDVVLSDELRANVQKAIESNCQNIDSQCVESVKGLLVSPDTELEARQLDTVRTGAALLGFLALAIPLFGVGRDSQAVPAAYHIPSSQVDPAMSAAQAFTVVAAQHSGAPGITITLEPNVASASRYVNNAPSPINHRSTNQQQYRHTYADYFE